MNVLTDAISVWLSAAPPAEVGGVSGLFGWSGGDAGLFIALPVLIVLSGFVSGSETALFSLTEAQRMSLRHRGSFAGNAVDALLADQRHLLVSILLANTTINVLYFVISSVLLMRCTGGATVQALAAATFFLLIVLGGEVGPKILATLHRTRFATTVAAPLLVLHRLLFPITSILRAAVIGPLGRLITAKPAPEGLQDEELKSLLALSERQGVIDPDEQRIVHDVVELAHLTARHVMTPRVRMIALPVKANRADVLRLAREHRLTQAPVYDGDLEHIVGVLHVKRYVAMGDASVALTDEQFMTPAHFVPDLASLEQVLRSFRQWKAQSAIVVDEYGQTEGLISIEDVVEEFIGDIVSEDDAEVFAPQLVGLGRWRVDGAMLTHEWAEAFGVALDDLSMATIGGLVVDRLSETPKRGDVVHIGWTRVEVEAVRGVTIQWLTVSLPDIREGAS